VGVKYPLRPSQGNSFAPPKRAIFMAKFRGFADPRTAGEPVIG
jgi:hypothetical protein